MKIRGIFFPGQGVQRKGMGIGVAKKYPNIVKNIFEEIDDSLKDTNLKVYDMKNGSFSNSYLLDNNVSDSQISNTDIAQPLILAQSYVLLRLVENLYGLNLKSTTNFVFGHSLGQFTALAASGVISFKDALWLVRQRGIAMKVASQVYSNAINEDNNNSNTNNTGMCALILPKGTYSKTISILQNYINSLKSNKKPHPILSIANYNSSTQIVISGTNDTILTARKLLEQNLTPNVPRPVNLNVSAAFHSPILLPAQEYLAKLLKTDSNPNLLDDWAPSKMQKIFYEKLDEELGSKGPAQSVIENCNIKINWPPPNLKDGLIDDKNTNISGIYRNSTANPIKNEYEAKLSLVEDAVKPVYWSQTISNILSKSNLSGDSLHTTNATNKCTLLGIGPGLVAQKLVEKECNVFLRSINAKNGSSCINLLRACAVEDDLQGAINEYTI